MTAWDERAARAIERYEDGVARLPDDVDERQRQLTRLGNAAWAAGLSLLMEGRRDEGRDWLRRSAERYRESWPLAPAESWGRPIGALKARVIADDAAGAAADAEWALEEGAAASESPIGRYAAVLAHLVLDRDEEAGRLAASLVADADFPGPVADALAALAVGDAGRYENAIRALLADFESRADFLEDVPVADTVLALEALAEARGLAARPASTLLPSI
jgi:hypothetical protein